MDDEIYEDMLCKGLARLDWSRAIREGKAPHVPIDIIQTRLFVPDFIWRVEWVWACQN